MSSNRMLKTEERLKEELRREWALVYARRNLKKLFEAMQAGRCPTPR